VASDWIEELDRGDLTGHVPDEADLALDLFVPVIRREAPNDLTEF
jgi:hypothetical protein